MTAYYDNLMELLHLTEDIKELAQSIGSNMEDNEVEHVELLQTLMEKRQDAIDHLSFDMQQADFQWTAEDRQTIDVLKKHNDDLQPLLTDLHRSFSAQLNRVNQTKQASKKYFNAYSRTATDGSFIDQRK